MFGIYARNVIAGQGRYRSDDSPELTVVSNSVNELRHLVVTLQAFSPRELQQLCQRNSEINTLARSLQEAIALETLMKEYA